MSTQNFIIAGISDTQAGLRIFPAGNYGRIGVQITHRGVPGRSGKQRGYRLYGVHGTTNRFPAKPQWTDWLHAHAHFIPGRKQWFLPLHDCDDTVHSELKAILQEAIDEWTTTMTRRRDDYFQHHRKEQEPEQQQ